MEVKIYEILVVTEEKMRNFVLVLASLLFVSSVSANYDYAEVIEKSLLFYEAQRTGFLPPDNR